MKREDLLLKGENGRVKGGVGRVCSMIFCMVGSRMDT